MNLVIPSWRLTLFGIVRRTLATISTKEPSTNRCADFRSSLKASQCGNLDSAPLQTESVTYVYKEPSR